ncbi:hypothetical protein G9C98_007124 [Cotesia typhae]|uniref:Trafficking protein particle complex subunit 8 n=1 Tax=Cotesia typhae TaxID=2053667 RepID=A0A8J5UYE8_9HYME|nr:hypothetical protein G9C98_007124 [Cotesia typhae]
MAQCKLTPREFISNAFSPQIGAVCSAAADAVCQKNNLSFIELLQPFCNLTTEEPSVARKMLNDSVSSEQCERTTSIKIGSTDLDIPLSVPWFESWREMFLNVQFPSDHEFTKHFLACMIVLSTADENPLEKIQQMAAQLHQSTPGKLPKWFNNNALRYYILIYDGAQEEKAKAESVFTEMKNLYDVNNCFLLQMNSRPPGQMDDNMYLPDPWSQFLVKYTDLTSSDHSSSPRTPADTGGVSAMPNQVTSGTDKPSSQAGTPVTPQNPVLLSPDVTDKISLSSEISEVVPIPVEVAQEVVPVTIHPLSPDSEKRFSSFTDPSTKSQYQAVTGSPINANVWADSPSRPVAQHGARLSTQDLERIRTLVTEFCIKSLLPYVEKQIGLLNDVISNKKGVSRSLFSATKRWFGTSKPGAPGSAPSNVVIYSLESSELQLRRLGDLCFMFGHYTLAYQAYHSAKRDFAADQAWLYYAGALEMAALSAFMQGEMTRKTVEYMDDAILTYSNSCKMPQFATRATILSAECLKGRNLYGDAAKQLIRMTSEDSDLRSALLLEQAAYCFISSRMMHKYAFHAVLAGHRFSKAGQRKHSLRCYQQAYQVYSNKGWSLAEDHIHFTIGRQAASLKQVEESVKAFEKLLSPSSKQPAVQQAAFLREFLHINNLVLQQVPAHFNGLPILPLPLIDGNETKVLLGPVVSSGDKDAYDLFDQDDTEASSRWSKLEETLVTEAQGSAPMIFKPSVALYSKKSNNTSKPNAIVDEPIHLSVELHNPLRISIPLYKIKLIWSFTKDGQTVSNETMSENSLSDFSSVDTKVVDSVVLQPSSKLRVMLTCTPTQMGELKILGISYSLANAITDLPVVNPSIMIHGKRLFEIRGPKLKNVKEKPDAVFYGVDYRLDINVVDKAPFMQVSFTKVTTDMLCGEVQRLEVTLKNIGSAPLTNVFVGSTDARLFCLERALDLFVSNNNINNNNNNNNLVKEKNNCVTRIVPGSKEISVGETLKVPLWIKAPAEKGNHRLDLLFYYENPQAKSTPRYRVSRHTWQLQVANSVEIKTIVRPSAVTKNNLPTMNLVVQVKNSNHSHEAFRNEITLTKMSLKSESWKLVDPVVDSFKYRIQPQETCHLLLKLSRRFNDESVWSDVALSEVDGKSIANSPYAEFVEKRNSILESGETNQSQNQILGGNSPLVDTVKLGATMILRWRAKVIQGETVVRETTGQHHVDLELVNKMYKHPEDALTEPSEYSTRLKIFGPDRNIPDSNSVVKKDAVDESELQKNVITQLYLPSVKSQLYVPQASTYFRYARHTTICCQIESYKRHSVKLQAVISSPGTYDLASRLDLSARLEQFDNFVPQKWRLESVCTVSEVHL